MPQRQGWTANDVPDLTGRRAIITGGNSGIGLAAAAVLAAHGMNVTITSRDAARGSAALATIRAQTPHARIACAALDLANLQSVRAFATTAVATPLDLLINNAGVMALPKREVTVDGFERQLGTNHLGHFALTGLLLPALLASPHSRIVTVSSLAHRRGKIHFDDLQLEHTYTPWRAYTQSKLANLMFALELQRRLAASGATAISVAVHPGVAATNLAANTTGRLGSLIFKVIGQSPARGALPTLMAATMPGIEGGAYLGPDGLREMRGNAAPAIIAPQARDATAAADLWHRSERLTGVSYV